MAKRYLSHLRPKTWERSASGKLYMHNYNIKNKAKYKKIVFDYYGWECSCCGERVVKFLSVDHVNNDGHLDRKAGRSGASMYRKIIKEGLPETYQILCMNCNFGKKVNGGVCPHITQ